MTVWKPKVTCIGKNEATIKSKFDTLTKNSYNIVEFNNMNKWMFLITYENIGCVSFSLISYLS